MIFFILFLLVKISLFLNKIKLRPVSGYKFHIVNKRNREHISTLFFPFSGLKRVILQFIFYFILFLIYIIELPHKYGRPVQLYVCDQLVYFII